MNRRTFLLAAASFTVLSTAPARADFTDDMVEWLSGQGYFDIEVTRTLLGRVRIVASLGKGRRELILNPRTGEVLRDIWIDADGNISAFSGGGGPGDDDDDDGHGGDDDNSGPGSGDDDNSGPGGGDDGNSGHGGSDSSGHGGGSDGGDDD